MTTQSEFAGALDKMLAQVFTRAEWAKIFGISQQAISQWVNDLTVPRPELLRMILDVAETTDGFDESVLIQFQKVINRPSIEVSPHGSRMGRTISEYMKRSGMAVLGNALKGATSVEERAQILDGGIPMSGDCADKRDDLVLLALRLLENEESAVVEAHASKCDTCRVYLAALRKVAADPRTWDKPPPINPERQALQREMIVALAKLQSRWIAAGAWDISRHHRDACSFWIEPVPRDGSTIKISYVKDAKLLNLVDGVVISQGQFKLDPSIIKEGDRLRAEVVEFIIEVIE